MPPGAMVTSETGLLPKAMSGYLALSRPRSELMYVALVTTKGCVDAWSLGQTGGHIVSEGHAATEAIQI